MSLRTRNLRLLLAALAISLCAPIGWAVPPVETEPTNPTEALSKGTRPAAATLEKIISAAVRNISKRYDLDEDQHAITEELMKRGVHRFLREHENEVWPVIGDLLRSRFGLEPPDSEDAKRFGKAVGPLFEAAKKAILEGNEEWRAILTPEQRRLHDYDLKDMERQFGEIGSNFQSWAEGNPKRASIFGRSKKNREGSATSLRLSRVGSEHRIFDPNPILETIVEEFIHQYKLDKGQVTAARSILEEFKGKANDYQASKKRELTAVTKARAEALRDRNLADIKRVEKDHKKLLVPIYALCDQMERRLEGLLTTAQKQRHGDRQASASPPTVRKTDVKKKLDVGSPSDAANAAKSEEDG